MTMMKSTMEPTNRTRVCSVVFIDIVKYSTRVVTEQLVIKEHFNAILLASLENVPANDRIILDTGDGAAICFLGDPEEPYFAACFIRNAVVESAATCAVPYQVRIGINLGPVRVVKDINGNLNVLGDGINDAQRVMSIADINQVLVSRSFYEIIANLSADYAHMFQFHGTHKDKHIREHTVFLVVSAGVPAMAGRPDPPEPPVPQAGAVNAPQQAYAAASGATVVPPERSAVLISNPEHLAELEKHLAREMGPVAKILLRNAVKKASSLKELKQFLTNEISSDKGKKSFVEAVKNIR